MLATVGAQTRRAESGSAKTNGAGKGRSCKRGVGRRATTGAGAATTTTIATTGDDGATTRRTPGTLGPEHSGHFGE